MNHDTDMTHPAVEVDGAERSGPWLVTCDHASNAVPDWIGGGSLGLGPADMSRHIAYDVGAAGVARALARRLGAPAVLSRFSRLVIDPNRGEDDPTLIMQLYDGTVIEGNRHIDGPERARRLDRLYRPYHAAISEVLLGREALVSVHSFTPQLAGRPVRPWHVGVLYAQDTRLSRPLAARLREDPGLVVGENEPYTGALPGDAVERHALRQGLHNTLIEIRNDLIETEAQQEAWGETLAQALQDVWGRLS